MKQISLMELFTPRQLIKCGLIFTINSHKRMLQQFSDTIVDNNDVTGNHDTVNIFHQAQSTLGWIGSVPHVEHNSLWETLALFIKTNREENTRHFVEYYYFIMLGISWDETLGRVEGYLYYTLRNLDLTNVNIFPKISRSLSWNI